MGYTCEYCGEQRSIVYCRSDAACLCLSCDRNVHSANALSQRHSRTLVCERCNSQPAIFRCVEERVSLCQNCDWVGHATSSTGLSTHKRQPLSCYTGCPSAVELSTIWSFLLDDPSVGDSTCEQGMGSMCITDSQPGVRQGSQAVEANDLQIPNEKSTLLIESSMPSFDNKLHNVELPVGSTNLTWSKVSNFGTKGSNLFEDDPFYVDFNMDEVDLSVENYEELFGVPLDDPAQLFENESIDALFGMKDTSVADSTCHDVNVVQGSVVKSMQPACSNAASVESMRSCKTEPPTLCFARAAHSSFSFSNVTGESSAGDYQDCGASSMFHMGEPPWCPPCSETSMPSTSRTDAVLRYKAKKKSRQFEKRVRYASRKERADVRRRVKGRFVKAGDAYDYDPLSETRSY